MASAQSEQSSFLQQELTCPVCLDLYRDPHLLPCGHNFCRTCLYRLKWQANRGRLRCPECRDSHRCGTNFQKNFKLANIADDYRHHRRATTAAATALKSRESLTSSLPTQQAKSVFAVPCDYCPSVTAEASGTSADGPSVSQEGGDKKEAAAAASVFAVKTCLKCEVSMCQEHLKPHLELPAFREHPLTEPMNDFWKRKCPDHDEIYRYYCMDDKMCVCNACTIEGHSGHTIKTLRNTMKDLKLQVTFTQQSFVLNQVLSSCRTTPSIQRPVWGGMSAVNERQYKSMPTHGIGRWRHLLPKEAPKKRRDKRQITPIKQILSATDTAYGTLNVTVSGYDMTVVEHYSQYIHNLCNRLGVKVADSYALPTKTTEVMLMQEQGTKMYVDAVLKTHKRVVQLSSLNAALCPVFMEVLLKHQPEGVQLSVKEHTEADFQGRFKARPELEGLMAQISQ
ncbi:uncharacterized protein LOC121889846 isoform X1 [Thunnus maccoyii]|uniref:uncharacterized protein LOC121889846 isoform X1 n=1 Tax=Thunnus maccoyii TaxID=8240 RepID=UPI001C4BF9E0|nr:uncharacterized protein LOC121889846 isoform X1 [Thunnus maccoyii]XP_042257993.1 uncharacterized protein LOC121889846 isoform X1 [Thunnus maccoyii]